MPPDKLIPDDKLRGRMVVETAEDHFQVAMQQAEAVQIASNRRRYAASCVMMLIDRVAPAGSRKSANAAPRGP